MAYERTVKFRLDRSGGVTFFVTVRGLPYQRTVGPRGLVTLHEAAVILNKDFSTLFRWAQARKIRVVPKPGLLMVPMSEIRRLLPVAGGPNLEPA